MKTAPILRWNPLREMEEMENRMATLFGSSPLRITSQDREENLVTTDWVPSVDITEDEKEYLIKADLPEMKKEDVHVTFEDGVLTITGERKVEKEEKNRKYHRIEREHGRFVRSFSLPENADATKIAAEFKEGVLVLRLPKNEKAHPRVLEVKIT
ncbi:MAG: Hsp20/alpha crystallin family protein [Opitutae bacterium]|nr:Hsp20/alpha crystallin family protein [Opitutae bacterium]